MRYQLESFWSEHTPQYEKETKRLENNFVETTIGSKTKPYPPITESRLVMVEVLLKPKPFFNINLPQTDSVTSK